MQKKLFSIEWPDEYGPEWLNRDFIMVSLFGEAHIYNQDIKVIVTDVTNPPPTPQPTQGGHDL